MKYIDLHTHQTTADPEVLSVYNLRAGCDGTKVQGPYSFGLHPWDSSKKKV